MRTIPDVLTLPLRTLRADGRAGVLLDECATFGPHGVLVHGRALASQGIVGRVLAGAPAGLRVRPWQHPGGEPTLDHLEALLAFAREAPTDWVAGLGGGSVLDLAKACAGLLRAPLSAAAYHDGAPIPPGRIPFLAAPSTAGTGSEATIVCVFTNARTGVKKSFRHASFMARTVVLDAELLTACPPATIAASGMDAFVQAVESYLSRGATWMTDEWALEAVRHISRALVPVFRGAGPDERRALMTGSYLAGLALSNARLGLVHGLAHPLGARYHQPHGLVCAVCLPPVLAFNAPAVGARYNRLCEAAGGDLAARATTFITELGLRSPFAGQPVRERVALVRETLESGSTAANPRPVGAADVEAILDALFA